MLKFMLKCIKRRASWTGAGCSIGDRSVHKYSSRTQAQGVRGRRAGPGRVKGALAPPGPKYRVGSSR